MLQHPLASEWFNKLLYINAFVIWNLVHIYTHTHTLKWAHLCLSLRYWYLGPLKTRAAHWFSTLRVSVVFCVHLFYCVVLWILNVKSTKLVCVSKEGPQMHHASVSYLPPIPRPPDLPDVKPVRPSLLYRIYRRLKNYWTPPAEGRIDVRL